MVFHGVRDPLEPRHPYWTIVQIERLPSEMVSEFAAIIDALSRSAELGENVDRRLLDGSRESKWSPDIDFLLRKVRQRSVAGEDAETKRTVAAEWLFRNESIWRDFTPEKGDSLFGVVGTSVSRDYVRAVKQREYPASDGFLDYLQHRDVIPKRARKRSVTEQDEADAELYHSRSSERFRSKPLTLSRFRFQRLDTYGLGGSDLREIDTSLLPQKPESDEPKRANIDHITDDAEDRNRFVQATQVREDVRAAADYVFNAVSRKSFIAPAELFEVSIGCGSATRRRAFSGLRNLSPVGHRDFRAFMARVIDGYTWDEVYDTTKRRGIEILLRALLGTWYFNSGWKSVHDIVSLRVALWRDYDEIMQKLQRADGGVIHQSRGLREPVIRYQRYAGERKGKWLPYSQSELIGLYQRVWGGNWNPGDHAEVLAKSTTVAPDSLIKECRCMGTTPLSAGLKSFAQSVFSRADIAAAKKNLGRTGADGIARTEAIKLWLRKRYPDSRRATAASVLQYCLNKWEDDDAHQKRTFRLEDGSEVTGEEILKRAILHLNRTPVSILSCCLDRWMKDPACQAATALLEDGATVNGEQLLKRAIVHCQRIDWRNGGKYRRPEFLDGCRLPAMEMSHEWEASLNRPWAPYGRNFGTNNRNAGYDTGTRVALRRAVDFAGSATEKSKDARCRTGKNPLNPVGIDFNAISAVNREAVILMDREALNRRVSRFSMHSECLFHPTPRIYCLLAVSRWILKRQTVVSG
jgi:hypothetical protein